MAEIQTKTTIKPGVMVHTSNPRPLEREVRVPGQPGLHSVFQRQKI